MNRERIIDLRPAYVAKTLSRCRLTGAFVFAILMSACIAMASTPAEKYFAGSDLEAVQALQSGNTAALKQALAAGANIDRPGRDGVVPMLLFIANGDTASMVRLFKQGARLDYRLPRPLGPKFPEHFGWVPASPDTAMLKALLAAGLDPNLKPDGAWPLIFWTINPFNLDALTALLKAGARINERDSLGGTVLHDAIQGRDYTVARWLIDQGADPTLRNQSDKTALDLLHRDQARLAKGSPVAAEVGGLLVYLAAKGFR